MVVYAVQNVISDPPFSRLDLISCRNVLIYLDTDLQRQLLPMFHFILNPKGYLFLGTSETIGEAADMFATVDLKWKIFQRKGTVQHRLADYPVRELPARDEGQPSRKEAAREMNIRTLLERLVLDEYAPPGHPHQQSLRRALSPGGHPQLSGHAQGGAQLQPALTWPTKTCARNC